MSTKAKSILFVVIIYTILTMIVVIGYKCGKQKDEQNKVVEVTKELIIEETTAEETEKAPEIKEEYIDVWTVTDVTVKEKPIENSKNIGFYSWNAKITVTYINDEWAKIKNTEYYIKRFFVSETPTGFVDYDVPENNTIKSYMDYRHITSTISNQYRLQQSLAYTGNYGIRMVNGRYCVAVGSYYTTTIGQYIDIELENGNVIKGILADCKADAHTDETNRINPNGSVLEFVVETESLNSTVRTTGDASFINDWNSKIVNIKVYDKIEEY